jgi:serine O-acetyltransferase
VRKRNAGAGATMLRKVQLRHPGFKTAVLADLAVARRQRGDHDRLTSRAAVVREVLRLVWLSDAFGALVLYRLKAACQRREIPVVPRLAHRLAMSWAQLSIGDPVLVHPGIILPHGQVVIDGFAEIHTGVRIRPYVTIGLKEGNIMGPTIREHAAIGTGAKVIGPVTIGAQARIGANSVVLDDVPARAVVGGVPARVLRSQPDAGGEVTGGDEPTSR